jgi:hypothetical protein
MNQRDEEFEEFVYQWTGKDIEYHNNAHTTGLSFAWACWNRALTFDRFKYAGLRNGKIVEFAKDKLALNHDHIDQIVEITINE